MNESNELIQVNDVGGASPSDISDRLNTLDKKIDKLDNVVILVAAAPLVFSSLKRVAKYISSRLGI